MVFCVFIFIFMFRKNVIGKQLGQNNFCRCYGFFFSKVSFRNYFITTMFKVLYQQLQNTLTTTFERHLTTEDFMNIGVKPAPRHLTYYCMLFFLSNKPSFKFNLMLIEQFLPQFIYLSIFWYCILKFIQYLYAFFIRASKFSWASMLFFCEGLQLQNVIIFFFSMKH